MKRLLVQALAAGFLGLSCAGIDAAEITLKYGAIGSGRTPFTTMGTGVWRKNIGEYSKGQIEVQEFLNTLGGVPELYKNTRDGIADIGWVISEAQKGFKFPRSEVLSLPGLLDGYSNVHANLALWRLYEKGLLKDDFSDVLPLGFASMSPAVVMTQDKDATLDALKGMKFAVSSGTSAQTARAVGAIPVFTPVTNLYEALNRKTVDGVMVGLTAVKAFRLAEVTNRYLLVSLDTPLVFIGINKRKFESLPAPAREAIMRASGAELSRLMGEAADFMVKDDLATLAGNAKQQIVKPGDSLKADYYRATQPVIDNWVKSTPNGAAILEAFRAELASVAGRR